MRRQVIAGIGLLVLMSSPGAWAARTMTWTENADRLSRGEADGVAITEKGALFPAPRVTRIGDGRTPGEPGQVWAVATDGDGSIYLGTGPDGHIVKIPPSGDPSLFFTVDEPLVTALTVDGRGDLLAGTAPGGVIYRIRPDGRGAVWSDTGEHYVWSLAVGSDGSVFAGTGERGNVLRIGRSGEPERFFDSDEAHIVSLLPTPDGGLLAGGAGRGLVYRIDGEGNGLVLFEDLLPEVSGLAVDDLGNVLVALIASPAAETKRPAVQLRLPDGVQVGRSDETVGTLEESTGPMLRGYIEGLPSTAEPLLPHVRGRLVRITPDGETKELWRSTVEGPFCLVTDDQGVVFGTGEPARIYRVGADGDVALLATLREAQLTELLRTPRAVILATSNPASTYRLDARNADSGVFVSEPFDAGGPARWGAIRWRPGGGQSGEIEIYTRTGNSRDPDRTWSAWGPALSDARRSRVVNPDGRYLQWRARFVGARAAVTSVSDVTVSYSPYNRPPRVRDFRLDAPGPWVAGEATFRWSALDPDRDHIELDLQYRPAAAGEWRSAVLPASGDPDNGPVEPGAGWHEDRLSWDTSAVDEGAYELRALASDQGANDPREGRSIVVEPTLRLVVDRTPPRFELQADGARRFEITLSDEHSEIRRLELIDAGRVAFSVRPADGVCDSRRESFTVELPQDGGEFTLRGFDAAGNHVDIPLPQ